MAEQILAALFVLGLLFATVWVLRRKGLVKSSPLWNRSRSNHMQVIERLALTPQHSLHLVRLGDEFLLIGVSPASCGALTGVPPTALAVEARRVS